MNEDTTSKGQRPVRPTQGPKSPMGARQWQAVGLVFLCFVAGALGSMVVIFAKGDVETAVSNNSRQVISSEGELISSIAKDVGSSTVSITTESTTRSSGGFFGNLGGGGQTQQGAGTGIIVSKNGYVLTNRHVIPDNAQNVTVTLSDGTEYANVAVVGRDSLNDIAFLKIDSPKADLPVAKIGDSGKIQTGNKVVAVGNALGQFQNTVTTGVISGIGRPLTAGDEGGSTEQLSNLFQTDAAINPGNSGGPLVNMSGEVIGMNTAVAEDAQGIGFAIPINDVKGLIKSVTEQGKLIRPFLGVRSVTLTPTIAKELNAKTDKGALISGQGSVVSGSPAEKAGLRPNDIITKVNDQEITEQNPLGSVIARQSVGSEITITINRDGKTETLKASLTEAPPTAPQG